MTEINFSIYWQEDVTNAISLLNAIYPTLKPEPVWKPEEPSEDYSDVMESLDQLKVKSAASQKRIEALNESLSAPITAAQEARSAEQELLNEAKKGRGRPPKKTLQSVITDAQKTPEEPKASLLTGGSTSFPADLEAALAVNFDELLLQDIQDSEPEEVEDLTTEVLPEPEPERSFDELKNMVTAKIKEPAYGMDWFKAVLKTTGAAKLSDLTAEQMRVTLDTAHVWLAEKEAVDLLG
jgi:hypothetical protein